MWQNISQCSTDVNVPEVPDFVHQKGSMQGFPRGGRTYLLSEHIERADGKAYKAPKMYIEDHTSRFFKPWRRAEIAHSDVTATGVTLYSKLDRRVVRFCADTAKDAAFWLVMRYGVFEVTGLEKSHTG